MDIKMVFATRLKLLREEKGFTQSKLAEELGVSRGSISFYENGDRTADIETLYKLSKLFNVSSDYLLGINDESTVEEYFDELNGRKIEINSKALDLYSRINNMFFIIQSYYYNKFGLENDGESDPIVPEMTDLIYKQLLEIIEIYTDTIDEMFYKGDKSVIENFLRRSKYPWSYCDYILLEILRLFDLV